MSGIQISIAAMEMNFQETLTQSSKDNVSEIPLDQKNENSSVPQGSKKIQNILPKSSSSLQDTLTMVHMIPSSGDLVDFLNGGWFEWDYYLHQPFLGDFCFCSTRDEMFHYRQVHRSVEPVGKAAGGWSDQVTGHAQRTSGGRSETRSGWDGDRTLSPQSGKGRLVRPGWGSVTKQISEAIVSALGSRHPRGLGSSVNFVCLFF